MASSSPDSLHAPLDATASSSRRSPSAQEEQREGGSSSSSSPSPSSPPFSTPLSNLDFYTNYHSSYISAASHHEAGRPYPPHRKPALSSVSFQDPAFLKPSGVAGTTTEWSAEDKDLFFAVLARTGKSRPDLIAQQLDGRKSFIQVSRYLRHLNESLHLANAPGRRHGHKHTKIRPWSLSQAPSAREVSDRWIELEEEFADALLEKKEAEEISSRAQERQDMTDRVKRKAGPIRLTGKGPVSQKQQEMLAELEKNDRGWTREDWSRSLDRHKLENVGLELANPIMTTYVEERSQPRPLPPPIERPDVLVQPMKDRLPADATYAQVQEVVTGRTLAREQERAELATKKRQYEREKKRMWVELKKQASRRRHRGGTRLQLAKLGVLKRYQGDGLDLLNLKSIGRHMSGLPSVPLEVPTDEDTSQEIAYPTLVDLKIQLEMYVEHLLWTAISHQGHITKKRLVVEIEEDGKLSKPRPRAKGEAFRVLTKRAVRKAQSQLGGSRYDLVRPGDSADEDEDDAGPAAGGNEEAVDGSPRPARLAHLSARASRSASVSSYSSAATSDCGSSAADDYDVFDADVPIWMPLPVAPTWDKNRTLPYRPKNPIVHPANQLNQIRSLPYPKAAYKTDRRVLTIGSLPPRDQDLGPDLQAVFYRPADRDVVVDESTDEDDVDFGRESDEWMEEDEEEEVERRDRQRDEEWERRVWETVENMDEDGQGWAKLGELMDLDDQDLTVGDLRSDDEHGYGSNDMSDDQEDDRQQSSSSDDPFRTRQGVPRRGMEDGGDMVDDVVVDSSDDDNDSAPPQMRQKSVTISESRSPSVRVESGSGSEPGEGDGVVQARGDEGHDADADDEEGSSESEED